MGKATSCQKIELYRSFFSQASELEAQSFVEAMASSETMAEFQGVLLGVEQEQEDLNADRAACRC